MFEITYKPRANGHFHNSDMIFDVLFNNDVKSEIATNVKNINMFYDYVRVRRSSIYKDVRIAVKKIMSIRMGWDAHPHEIRNLYIVLSKTLHNEEANIIEHVVCKMINSFYSDVQMNKVNLIVTHDSVEHKDDIHHCVDIASKVLGGRMLAMLPANVATPAYVAHYIQHMFKEEKNINIKVLHRDRLYKDGYNLLLGIGDSAKNPPKMVIIERRGTKHGKTIAIVGKGITFDSGGLAIKPYNHMVDMKFDKIGAVYGSVALLHLIRRKDLEHITFIGCFPLAENAVSEKALRPGDIVQSRTGLSIEISNPDAEGRLILADAFSIFHEKRYHPDVIIDIATLTGHASSINCWHTGYFYANDVKLKEMIEKITDEIGERMIAMPMWDDYDDVLKSNVADMTNSPLQCSDAFVAARFLSAFVPSGVQWVHIDLAHETDNKTIPVGNGIRSIISIVEKVSKQNKK